MKAHVLAAALVFPAVVGLVRAGDSPTAPAPAAKPAAAVPVLQHLAVVGASVSAGIGLDPGSNPFAGEKSRLQLAQIVDASIAGPHETPWNGADFNFFSSPEGIAKRSAADAKAAKPTALVAIDYLFWMGYGSGSDEKREKRVEAGLELLDGFTCPVLVGDLPDFHGAGTNPLYLPKESIPSAEVLARINKRVYAWAKAKKNVVVVPMAEMLRKLIVDEPLTVAGTTYGKGSKSRLLQADNLHTTLEGTCALWALAVETWRAQDATLPADAIQVDVPALVEKARATPAAAPKVKGKRAKPAEKAGKQDGPAAGG